MFVLFYSVNKTDNWQCFFQPSIMPFSTMLWSRAVVSRAGR